MSKIKFYSQSFIVTIFLISFANISHAEDETPRYNLAKNAKDLYLKSFLDKKTNALERTMWEEDEKKKKKIETLNLEPKILSNQNIRTILMQYIIDFERNWGTDKDVYNKYLISDLDVYIGKNKDPKFSLISQINRTKTIAGECTLATLLARPTTDILDLTKRQNTIKAVIRYKSEQNTIDRILDTYKTIENNVLSVFFDKDPIYDNVFTNFVEKEFLFKTKSRNTVKFLGNYKCCKDILSFLKATSINMEMVFVKILVQNLGCPANRLESFPFLGIPFAALMSSNILLMDNADKLASLQQYSYLIPSTYMDFKLKLSAINDYKNNDKILHCIAKRLYDFSLLLRIAKKLNEIIENNEDLQKNLGDKIHYLKNLNVKLASDQNLRMIFNFLMNNPEKLRDWHYFRDNAGYILFIYDNLKLLQDNIIGAIAEIGLIDTYFSCANIFKEMQTKKNHLVFANFISPVDAKSPYIKFEKIWNPFLNPNIAIPNNVEMGEDSNTKCNTMIITGPNAGGKSTFTNSVILTIILAQTLGIAPGQNVTLTPFCKINSYIEIKDDVASGESAFIAEVNRGLYNYQILKNLKENQFSFSVFDEPFRGTNPIEGAAAEYSILEKTGYFKNNLSIVTTHYPIMTLLEEKNFNLGFRNYKVYITKNKNGKIIFTYKIIPGKSKQNIAIDILSQQGYKNEILRNANNIINNPKLFETRFEENKVSQGQW